MGNGYGVGVHRSGDGSGSRGHVVVGHGVVHVDGRGRGRVLLLLLDVGRLVGVLLRFDVGVDWLDVGMSGVGYVAGLWVGVGEGVLRFLGHVVMGGVRRHAHQLPVDGGHVSHASPLQQVCPAT